MRHAVRFAIAALGVLLVLVVTAPARAGRWVIPPGQEALVGRMLGGDLPGGCRFLGASIEKTEVRARYACAGGEVRLALRHPSDAPNAAVRAKQLAVVPEGAAPPELLAVLGERLRVEEPAWRWMAEGRSIGRTLAEAGLSPRARRLVLPLGAAAAIAFAATLALALAAARRLDRGAPVETGGDRGRAVAGEAAIVFAAAFLFLWLAFPAAPVHADSTRDLLMAADCLAGHPCDHGPPTTLGVIVQGALWTRWLALCRALGLGVTAVQAALYLLYAAGAAVMYASTRRRFGRDLAPAVAAIFTAATAYLLDVPILWNPSLSPLPLAAFHAALVALAWDREDADRPLRGVALAAGAAFALALAIDCHVLFAVLVPALLAAIAGCARRPIPATAAALVVLALTLAVDSRTAWSVNARAFVEAGAAAPLGGMLILAGAAAALSRARIGRLSPRARAAVFIAAASAYTTFATLLLFRVLGPAAGHRYLVPAVPGLALAVAAITKAVARRTRAATALQAAAAAAIVLGLWRVRVRGGDWSLADAEIAAREVYRRAPAYRDVLASARARSPATVAALAIFEPRGATAGGDPGEDLLLFLAPIAIASPRAVTVRRGARAIVVASVRPFLDRRKVAFCFAPLTGAAEEMGCAAADLGTESRGPETPEERAYPSLAAVRDAFPPDLLHRFGGVRQTITITVRPSPGPAHRVALLDDGSGYRIAAVRGVRFRGDLPAKQVLIEAGEGAGEILLAREEETAAPRPDRYWMPPLVEVPEDDAALVRLVEEGR